MVSQSSTSRPADPKFYPNPHLLYVVHLQVLEVVELHDVRTRLGAEHLPEDAHHGWLSRPAGHQSVGHLRGGCQTELQSPGKRCGCPGTPVVLTDKLDKVETTSRVPSPDSSLPCYSVTIHQIIIVM